MSNNDKQHVETEPAELQQAVRLLQHRPQDALNILEKLVATHPYNVEIMTNAGIALTLLGRYDEADSFLQMAISVRPQDAIILTCLGNLERERSNLPSAANYYHQAFSHHPDHVEAYYQLADLLLLHGKKKEAENLLRAAINTQPVFAPAYYALGQLLASKGEINEALSMLEHAKTLTPENEDILASIAQVYLRANDQVKALNILEPLLKSSIVSPIVSLIFAELAPNLNRANEAIEFLQQQLQKSSLPAQLLARIRFSLGRLYDATGDFPSAFEQFHLGNKINENTQATKASLAQIQILKQAFPELATGAANHSSIYSNLPVFIVGLPRSGTTLVEQILACHPQMAGAGELTYIGDLLNSFPARFGQSRLYPYCVSDLSKTELDILANDYLDKLQIHAPDAKRITDKMPHNFLHLGLIAKLLPESRIIHCVRNPLDTCLSIYFHSFSTNHPYAANLESLGQYYKAYTNLMDYWKSTLNIPIMDVIYEDLVANQENISHAMVTFCGLEWDEACMYFYNSDRIVNTPSRQQVRKPLYTNSIGRWKNYESNLKPLQQALG